MELKNIFKMEMFKNRNDKPYLLVIAILTVMAAVASIVGVSMLQMRCADMETLYILEILLAVFTGIGFAVFSLLYPFHLLNVDYKNRVMSLIFATGVSRGKYYFVKISATILSTLLATLVILFVPMVTFLIAYPDTFVEVVRYILKEFNTANILAFVLSSTIGLVANIVMLTTAVIITKGKTSGIFLFFGFLVIASMVQSPIQMSVLLPSFFGTTHVGGGFSSTNFYNVTFYLDAAFSILKVIVFALIGLNVLKKQDL